MTIAKSIEAEQAVIGALMLLDLDCDECQRVFSLLSPSSFAEPDHQILFAAIRSLAERGGSADVLTLGEECRKDKRFRADIDDYLVEIVSNTPTAANVAAYAEIVRDRAIERVASQKLNEALAVINNPYEGDIYKRLGMAESMITAILERGMKNKSGLKHVKDIGKEWLPEVLERVEGGVYRGFTLGIDALDRMLYPKRVPAGSLVVLGARPKMGKTGFMTKIIEHFAVNRKEAVATFSLEMPNSQIYERLLTGAAEVNPELFYRPANDADDWQKINSAAHRLNESLLFIDDTPGIRISHVLRETRALNRKHNVRLVAVDYLTLMDADGAERNDLAYGAITKALKNLAKEINGVVLLLTQLNRKLEDRGDKRPMPSDSRDTGQIEQDCDLWIGLYREAVYNRDAPSESMTEAIVRLNRHGKTGTAYFDLIDGTIREIDQDRARESSQIQPKTRGLRL